MSDINLVSMSIGCNVGDYQVGDRLNLLGMDWMIVSCDTEDLTTMICTVWMIDYEATY